MPRFLVDIDEHNLYTVEVLADDLEDARLRALRAASGPPQGSTREIMRIEALNGHRATAGRQLGQLSPAPIDVATVVDGSDDLTCRVAGCAKPGPWKSRQSLAVHARRAHNMKLDWSGGAPIASNGNGSRKGGALAFEDVKAQSREPAEGTKLRGVLDYVRDHGEVTSLEVGNALDGERSITSLSILVSRGWLVRVGIGKYRPSVKQSQASNGDSAVQGSQASNGDSTARPADKGRVKGVSASGRLWRENEPTGHGKTLWDYAKQHGQINTDDAQRLLGIPRSQASVYLSNLSTAGRIVRIGPGVYQGVAGEPASPASNGKSTDASEPAPGTKSRQMLDFIREHGDSTVDDVQDALPQPKASIRSALARFNRQGWLERVGEGVYRATAQRGEVAVPAGSALRPGETVEAAARRREKDRVRKQRDRDLARR